MEALNPKTVVPIHTFYPEQYGELFPNVQVHGDGEWWAVGLSEGRALSKEFMKDLLQPERTLTPLLERVKKDHTLMLAIRDGYVNIYYRGGNILRVTEHHEGYLAFFDDNFNESDRKIPSSPVSIISQEDTQNWVESFAERKNIMDEYFSAHGKAEREFQQLVARENNCHLYQVKPNTS